MCLEPTHLKGGTVLLADSLTTLSKGRKEESWCGGVNQKDQGVGAVQLPPLVFRTSWRVRDGGEMPASFFRVSPSWWGDGQGGRMRRCCGMTGRLTASSGANHRWETLIAPQAIHQTPPACRHKCSGLFVWQWSVGLRTVQHLTEAQTTKSFHQTNTDQVGLVSACGFLGRARQVRMWGSAQVQPVHILEKKLCRSGG